MTVGDAGDAGDAGDTGDVFGGLADAMTHGGVKQAPWTGDTGALVVVDWSWWAHKAYELFGVGGMRSKLVEWLTQFLATEPAHALLALDSLGPTFRHGMQHPYDPEWEYKKGRDPLPDEYRAVDASVVELVRLHGVPALRLEGYEADDVVATVTARARALGYRVWVVTADKDLHALCEGHPDLGVLVGTWDNFTGSGRGPAEVRAHPKWGGVGPHQMTDFLALTGDAVDNVPGAPGVGPVRAGAMLAARGDLDAVLAMEPADGAALDLEVRRLERSLKQTGEVPKGVSRAEAKRLREGRSEWVRLRAEVERVRGALPAAWLALPPAVQAVERDCAHVKSIEPVIRFSKALTTLDCAAPLDVPWGDVPVGGINTVAVAAWYLTHGFSDKLSRVGVLSNAPKRLPWAAPDSTGQDRLSVGALQFARLTPVHLRKIGDDMANKGGVLSFFDDDEIPGVVAQAAPLQAAAQVASPAAMTPINAVLPEAVAAAKQALIVAEAAALNTCLTCKSAMPPGTTYQSPEGITWHLIGTSPHVGRSASAPAAAPPATGDWVSAEPKSVAQPVVAAATQPLGPVVAVVPPDAVVSTPPNNAVAVPPGTPLSSAVAAAAAQHAAAGASGPLFNANQLTPSSDVNAQMVTIGRGDGLPAQAANAGEVASPKKTRGKGKKANAASDTDDGELVLFVDVHVANADVRDLEQYVCDLMAKLAEKASLPDVRLAPLDHALGFGKWKVFLQEYVRREPPKGWCYLEVGNSEVKQIVAEALRPLATGGFIRR